MADKRKLAIFLDDERIPQFVPINIGIIDGDLILQKLQ